MTENPTSNTEPVSIVFARDVKPDRTPEFEDWIRGIGHAVRQFEGYLGMDVYEEEADLFFEDLSNQIIQDDVLARLLTLPNVLITGHQGFFTENALKNIAHTTLANIQEYEETRSCQNEVRVEVTTTA